MLNLTKKDIKKINEIAKLIPSRIHKPIMRNVFIAKNGNGFVNAYTTDLEIWIKLKLESLECHSPYLIPKNELKNLRDDTAFQVNPDDKSISIFSGDLESRIPQDDFDEFPCCPTIEKRKPIPLPEGFRRIIKTMAGYCDYEPSRYAIGGILLAKNGDLVATNGKWLALAKDAGPKRLQGHSCIIPARVGKWIESASHVIDGENEICFICPDRAVFVRKMEGEYPNYKAVMPKDLKHSIKFDNAAMLKAVQSVKTASSEESKALMLDFRQLAKLGLSCKSPDYGEKKTEIKTLGAFGDIIIGVDPKYLEQGLKDTKADCMNFKDADSAMLLKGSGLEVLIMPIQIQ